MLKKYSLIMIIVFVLSIFLMGCNNTNSNSSEKEVIETSIEKDTELNLDDKVKEQVEEAEEVEEVEEVNEEVEEVNEEVEEVNEEVNEEVKKVTALNKNKMVIVLDPGHGGTTSSEKEPISPGSTTMKLKNVSGTSGVVTKISEAELNLSVALKLEKYLTEAGYTVVMTRTSSSETLSNVERAEIGNEADADLVVRIHADGSNDSSVHGASMLVPGNVGYAKDIFEISGEYGEIILNKLTSEVGMKNRGIIVRDDITGFNWSKVPVVLVEMGYMSNVDEDNLLATDNYKEKIAKALYQGIDEALK
jgi:N-acetylmuramoyl-L-alanine amidase